MKILVDAHVFLWALAVPERLGKWVSVLESRTNRVFVSSVSVTELMIKHSIGKIVVSFDVVAAIESVGFEAIVFFCEDALPLKEMPFHHRDPFDRMLMAQAMKREMKLMTAYAAMKKYD